jgi:transposase
MRCIFLPPCSPDYNPIELAFESIKAWIRRHGQITREDMEQQNGIDIHLRLHEALSSVTQDDIIGYFRHCGYIP